MSTNQELLGRGVANILPDKNLLQQRLENGEKLNIYLGIDPTAPYIHLGHAVLLRKLQAFAEMGHNVTFLIGDFTAKIGDTSDKESERPALTDEQIQENFKTYKQQAEKILDFSKVAVRYNSEWLSKLSFDEIIRLCMNFSVGDFVGRELVKKRMEKGLRVGLHEVLYPVMQGYDSYVLNTDLQLGGTDQTFNMMAGRTLVSHLLKKESFILTMGFLEGTDGRKMSKSWGNAVWIADSPSEMYGKIMSLSDSLISNYFELATNVSQEKIEEVKQRLEHGENPMNLKKELAFKITSELHSQKEAQESADEFERVVQRNELPGDIPEITVPKSTQLRSVASENGLIVSNSEWKRLIDQNGIYWNNIPLEDSFATIEEDGILQVGKRKYVKITVT